MIRNYDFLQACDGKKEVRDGKRCGAATGVEAVRQTVCQAGARASLQGRRLTNGLTKGNKEK